MIWAQVATRYVDWRFYGTYKHVDGFNDHDKSCFMNFMEHFFACAYQTLPSLFIPAKKATKPSWVPDWLVAEEEVGLNMQLPISQGSTHGRGFGTLVNSSDPEVRELFKKKYQGHLIQAGEKGRATMKAQNFERVSKVTKEASNGFNEWWRHADPEKGEPQSVLVRCDRCKEFEWTDPMPSFSVTKGLYMARKLKRCDLCAKSPKAHLDTFFIPVDPDLKWERALNVFRRWSRANKKANSVQPAQPVQPVQPAQPAQPTQPAQLSQPRPAEPKPAQPKPARLTQSNIATLSSKPRTN